MVRVPGRISGKPVKKFFKTEAEAQAYCDRLASGVGFEQADLRKGRSVKRFETAGPVKTWLPINWPKPRPFPQSKSSPWMVIVPREIAGHRVKKYFKTQADAQAYCERLASGGFEKADIRQTPLDGEPSKPPLAYCIDRWLDRVKANSKATFLQARTVLTRLGEVHGRAPIDKVGVNELDSWLRSLTPKYSFTTQHNHWRRTRHFFAYCHDSGLIAINPFRNPILKEPRRVGSVEHPLLRPEHMKILLEAAKGDRLLTTYLCLGSFAGIRTEEILRMDWDDILWDEGEIRVPHAKRVANAEAKYVWLGEKGQAEEISGDRIVTMQEAFRRNVEPLALKGEAIDRAAEMRPDGGHGSRRIIPGGQRTLYSLRVKLRDILQTPAWPDNILRHSFASYHYAFFRNLELTRVEMGHSHSNMTKYTYVTARLKVVAEQWWAL